MNSGETQSNASPRIGIAIPVWNAKAYTLACLDSLAAMDFADYLITVVDNGSTDGTAEEVRRRWPDIGLIREEENRGFAFACNRGMDRLFSLGCDYVLLLNNDTLVRPDMLAQLLDCSQRNPRAGILGPKICYADRPTVPWFTGLRFPKPVYFVRTSSPKAQVQSDVPTQVDFISGCGMLITRAVYSAIGGLSEDYFMYYEDLDYCLTAKQADFELWYVPSAVMWHKVSVSSGGKDSPVKQYYQVKSSLVFCSRHTFGLWRWLNLALRFGHAGYTLLGHLVKRRLQWDSVRQYVRGVREGSKVIRRSSG